MSARLASIVIPVWNRHEFLGRAISSVLAQTASDLEVVVVDNGSQTPNEVATVVSPMADERVRLIRLETNRGPSGGRNAGAAVAHGELLGFLDSDDELEPTWLAEMRSVIEREDADVATCGFVPVDTEARVGAAVLPTRLGPAFHGVTARFDGAPAFLVRRDLFEAVGGYDERLWFGENTELGLRLVDASIRDGRSVASVPRPLLRWHREDHSRYPAALRLAAAEVMLQDHAALLTSDAALLESHLAVAGVCAARLADYSRARRYFWELTRRRPTIRNGARYALACVPLAARRVWRDS